MAGKATVAAASIAALAAVSPPASALPPIPSSAEPLLPAGPVGTRGPLGPTAPALLSAHPPVRDAIVARGSRSARGVETAAAAQFETPDGYMITVRWGDTSPYGPADAQAMVDFLATLLHGTEMRSLSVFLATSSELDVVCGPEAISCYSPLEEEIIIAGDPGSSDGLTREFVIAHEYGHHVANNRNNAPFPALWFGPKYWATQQHVCEGVAAGRYQPLGSYYRRPGEAFAESFAFYHYPDDTPWEWLLFPHPNAASLGALRRDTLSPWHKRITGRVIRGIGGRDVADAFLVHTPLDGRLTLKLRAHNGSDLDMYVLARKKLVLFARATGSRARKKINLIICGASGVRVLVVADHGGGRYTLKALRP